METFHCLSLTRMFFAIAIMSSSETKGRVCSPWTRGSDYVTSWEGQICILGVDCNFLELRTLTSFDPTDRPPQTLCLVSSSTSRRCSTVMNLHVHCGDNPEINWSGMSNGYCHSFALPALEIHPMCEYPTQ